jgi:hypothetical protein
MIIKKRFPIPVYIVFVLLILSGCEFRPDDVPETQIDPSEDSGPPIFISLNDRTDTIKIGWNTEFSYNISGTDNKINYVIVTFEDIELHHFIGDYGQIFSFSLDPASYSNGSYHLNIKIFTATGSGSIADKVGAEGYLYELDWPVIVDRTLPEGIANYTIRATKTISGVDLSWPSFDHPNFISYVIYRHYPGFLVSAVPVTTISDPLITTYTDTTYWEGQNAMYYLRIVTPAGFFEGEYIWFYDYLTGLKATWHPDGTVDVTWDKSRNLESFGKYYVYSGYRYDDFIEEYYIEDPDHNYVKLKNAGFGSGLNIFLKFIPKGVDPNSYRYLNYAMIGCPTHPMIPTFLYCCNVNNHNFLILSDLKKIYRYFPYEVRTEDTISVNIETYWLISVSNNGDRFVYYQNEKFYIRRTNDFFLENEFTGPPLQSMNRTLQSCSLADNGNLLAIDNEGYAYLYDTQNGLLIRKDSMGIRGWYPEKLASISPDGTKMVARITPSTTALYALDQAGWAEVGRTDIVPFNLFYSEDGTSVYIAGFNEIQNHRTDNFMMISDYSLPGGVVRFVDLDRGKLFCSTDREFENIIVDLNTGQVIRSLVLGTSWCWLFDNYLVTSGLQLTLTNFK